jgi:simple sugar transport system permease protein
MDEAGGLGARFEALLIAVGAVAITAIAGTLLLVAGGQDPAAAAGALVRGSVGSWSVFISFTLVRSIPLILTGLAVALAFKAGVWNIGAEGQLYAGAIAATWVGLSAAALPAPVLVPAVLLASLVAGALWALLPAVMRVRFGVGEVITTILMNFVGIHLASWAVHGPLREPRGVFPQSAELPMAARLPALSADGRLHFGLVIGLVLAAGLTVLFRSTRFGFQIRATGASPLAARVSGRIDTRMVVLTAFLASGAIAGLAGGAQVSGLTFALYEGLSPGWGYTAIAVALLARLHPAGVVATAILFGALQAGSGAMQREAGIGSDSWKRPSGWAFRWRSPPSARRSPNVVASSTSGWKVRSLRAPSAGRWALSLPGARGQGCWSGRAPGLPWPSSSFSSPSS